MTIETEEELEHLKRIGRVVAACLTRMSEALEPGITTAELDAIGAASLAETGAVSAPQTAYEFPGVTCISINEEVAHGIPGPRTVKAGDLVHIDVSASLDGFFSDTGASFMVPPATKVQRRLCAATRGALQSAMKRARATKPINRIGQAIDQHARRCGFAVILDLASHGIGRALHEDPESILNYYEPRDKRRLEHGAVITLEPFLTTGLTYTETAGDGWTLLNSPGSFTAQYEHTMVITKGQPIVLT